LLTRNAGLLQRFDVLPDTERAIVVITRGGVEAGRFDLPTRCLRSRRWDVVKRGIEITGVALDETCDIKVLPWSP